MSLPGSRTPGRTFLAKQVVRRPTRPRTCGAVPCRVEQCRPPPGCPALRVLCISHTTTQHISSSNNTHHTNPPPHPPHTPTTHTHHTHPPHTHHTHPPHTPTTHPPQPSTVSKKSQCSIASPTVSQANIIKHRYTHITLKNLRVDSTLARGQVESPFLRHNKTHEKCTLRGIMSQHVMSCQRPLSPYIQWR